MYLYAFLSYFASLIAYKLKLRDSILRKIAIKKFSFLFLDNSDALEIKKFSLLRIVLGALRFNCPNIKNSGTEGI